MIKTFIFGIVLGVAMVFAAAHLLPAVDQYREASIISVAPNGGNAEAFHVNVPHDRIMIGAQGQNNAVPASMEWPQDALFEGARTELFKLRNSRDAVVGVASRLAANNDKVGDIIEWVLHLPARGSFYVPMQTETVEGSYRTGELRAGTREFDKLHGQLSERWVADAGDAEDGLAGRIELMTIFVSTEDTTDDVTGDSGSVQ